GAEHGGPRVAPSPFTYSLFTDFRRALRETALENALGNAVFQDFNRAAGDHPAAAFAETVFHQRFVGIAHAAHDLHGFVADVEAGLVAEGLGDGGVVGRRNAAVGIDRGAIEQQLAGIKLHFHVGEFPLDA